MKAFQSAQAKLVLHNQRYACILTALLAFLPFTEWLALATVALVTLRKGWDFGLKLVSVSALAIALSSLMASQLPSTIIISFIPFVLIYFLAVLLRAFASWQLVANFVLISSLVFLWIIHSFFPEYIIQQYNQLLEMLKLFDGSEMVLNFLQISKGLKQNSLANYVMGIRVVGLISSVYCSLMIARSLQATLFCPGEFRKELLDIRANRLMVIPLVLSINGAFAHNSLAILCLPILMVYFIAAGLSLFFYFRSKSNQLRISIILLISFILTPYIIVPAFVILGGLDSLFNFRLRLQRKVNA